MEKGALSPSILRGDDDICLSMIVVAEYLVGLELASHQYRPRMQGFLDHLLSFTAVLPYDEETLDAHVRLLAWTREQGRPRGQHDLIIAAMCITTGRTLITTDRRARFNELPGLEIEVVG